LYSCVNFRLLGMPHSTTIVKYSFEIVEDLMVTLNQRGIAAQVTFFDEKPWIRLSAQVYNRTDDYIQLRGKMTQILNFQPLI